jgi:hypothetical protein
MQYVFVFLGGFLFGKVFNQPRPPAPPTKPLAPLL